MAITSSINIRYQINGKDAERMWIVPSTNYIVKDTGGNLSPTSLTCKVNKQTGSGAASNVTSGFTLQYRINGGSWTNTTVSSVISIPTGTTMVELQLIVNSVTVDKATILTIDSGGVGPSPDHLAYVFKWDTAAAGPGAPTGTTVEACASASWLEVPAERPGASYNLWMSCAMISGVNAAVIGSWSAPVQVSGEDGAPGMGMNYRFQTNNNKDTPPNYLKYNTSPGPGWDDYPTASIPAGYYLWMTQRPWMDGVPVAGSQWSYPTRLTGADGAKGNKGDKGDQGEQGEDATVYYFTMSANKSVRDINGQLSPSTITPTLWMRQGSNAPVEVTSVSQGSEHCEYWLDDDKANRGTFTPGSTLNLSTICSPTTRTVNLWFRYGIDRATPNGVVYNDQQIFATETIAINQLYRPGVVRVRKWEDCPKVVGTKALWEFQDGKDTTWLDIVMYTDGAFYLCKKGFSKQTNYSVAAYGGAQQPSGGYLPNYPNSQYWEPSVQNKFLATDVFLAQKAKIDNLYTDEVYIYEDGNTNLPAFVANSTGVFLKGAIQAGAIGFTVGQPANESVLTAPLNVINLNDLAGNSISEATYYLPCLAEGVTREIKVLVVHGGDSFRGNVSITFGGTRASNSTYARVMSAGAMDTTKNALTYKLANTAINVKVGGLYTCIGFRLRGENTTWWEVVRLNDGQDYRRTISGTITPKGNAYAAIEVPVDVEDFSDGQNNHRPIIGTLN